MELTVLFRPVGQREYDLIAAAGFRRFLRAYPNNPFFYPVTNEEYATQIALPPRNDISSSDLNATTVFPDIIVHKRGTGRNLVVIEVKKSTNRESDDWDLAKLKAFKSELHYDVAMFFRFRIGAKDGKFDDPIIL